MICELKPGDWVVILDDAARWFESPKTRAKYSGHNPAFEHAGPWEVEIRHPEFPHFEDYQHPPWNRWGYATLAMDIRPASPEEIDKFESEDQR